SGGNGGSITLDYSQYEGYKKTWYGPEKEGVTTNLGAGFGGNSIQIIPGFSMPPDWTGAPLNYGAWTASPCNSVRRKASSGAGWQVLRTLSPLFHSL
ncbi:hypothetical protein ACFL7M_19345, partial [Thermodesulfobacteriota bacterium]